jgi:hypothetical protein
MLGQESGGEPASACHRINPRELRRITINVANLP